MVKLTVRDEGPRVAAAMANALAAEVIETGLTVSGGRAQRILAEFDRQIGVLDAQIAASDPTDRSALVEERAAIQAERVNVLASEAGRSQPSIISRATPPPRADTAPITAYAALGALLGLILGIGLAGLVETIRPTIVGGDALASALDVRLLGTVASLPDEPSALATLGPLAQRLGLAADTSGIDDLALLSIGPDVELGPLADRLGAEMELKRRMTLDAPDTASRAGGGPPGARLVAATTGLARDDRSCGSDPSTSPRGRSAVEVERVSWSSRRRCSPGMPWQTGPTSSTRLPARRRTHRLRVERCGCPLGFLSRSGRRCTAPTRG